MVKKYFTSRRAPARVIRYITKLAKQIVSKNFVKFNQLRNETNIVYKCCVRHIWKSKRLFRKIVVRALRKRQESNGQYHAKRVGHGNLDELVQRSQEQYKYYKYMFDNNRKP